MTLHRSIPRRLLALTGAVTLTVAACGGEDAASDEQPPVAGACEEGVADCDDTIQPSDEPSDEPSDPISDEPSEPVADEPPGDVSSGVLADGGLSVADALGTDATGVLAVRGFVVADPSGIRLCDSLLESLPPQCGGASIELANLDTIDAELVSESQGVRWTDQQVVVIGDIAEGVLVPAPNASA